MPLLALLVFACAPQAPILTVEAVPPVEAPESNVFTLVVPADCAHVIVDILSDTDSDVTVACFRGSDRTFLANERGPPLGRPNDPNVAQQFVLSYLTVEPPVSEP